MSHIPLFCSMLPFNTRLPATVGLIWAQSSNGVIGRNNDIPSEFAKDFAYFKKVTLNTTVVMGRKTWESLPRKPLPDRVNVILTRQVNYKAPEGVVVIASLDELKVTTEKLFFIGGKDIYELGIPFANEIHVTLNEIDVIGDVFAPSINFVTETPDWKLTDLDIFKTDKGHLITRSIYLKDPP